MLQSVQDITGDVPNSEQTDRATSPSFMLEGIDVTNDYQIIGTEFSEGSSSSAQSSATSSSQSSAHAGGSRGSGTPRVRPASRLPAQILHPAAPSSASSSSTSSVATSGLQKELDRLSQELQHSTPTEGSPLTLSAVRRQERLWQRIQAIQKNMLDAGIPCATAHNGDDPAARAWQIFSMQTLRTVSIFHNTNLQPWFFLTGGIVLVRYSHKRRAKGKGKKKNNAITLRSDLFACVFALLLTGSILTSFTAPGIAEAATTVPANQIYRGRLLSSTGTPLTGTYTLRFSYWDAMDVSAGDVDGAGAINTGATHYANWQEVQTVTPSSNGSFSVQLGSVTPMPDFATMPTATLLSLHRQVEVKAAAAADTSYEILDADGAAAGTQRFAVLSIPFARNAELLDQHDTGTGSGNIPFLLSGGLLPVSTMAGGTNSDFFTIDSNDSAATAVSLKFGTTLGKTLLYNIPSHRFEFNDDLRVQGSLNVTGLINGFDLSTLQSPSSEFKVTVNSGLLVRVNSGSYRLSSTVYSFAGTSSLLMANNALNYVFFGSGGLTVRTSAFPTDESAIPIAKVTTAGGTVSTIVDARVTLNDDREQTKDVVLHPEFADAALQGDGTSNVGQLTAMHDAVAQENYYSWTSTKAALQDYDILVKVSVPQRFSAWNTNPLRVTYRSTSASALDNKLDIAVFDSNGQPVTITGTSTDLASTSWATTTLNFGGSPIWTPGTSFLLRFRLSARNNEQMQLGDAVLSLRELSGP